MRHKMDAKKFGRTSSHRHAMWRNMATSLFREGRIRTTEAKAKELRRVADRLVTLAKRAAQFTDSDEQKVIAHRLHLRRQAYGFIMDKAVVAKLFDELAEQYLDRNGGYTRVVKLGQRHGDGAWMALIELVTEAVEEKPKKKRAKKGVGKKAAGKKDGQAKVKAAKKDQKQEAAVEEKPAEEVAQASEEEAVTETKAEETAVQEPEDKAEETAAPVEEAAISADEPAETEENTEEVEASEAEEKKDE